ncbi:3-hydroxybenzoate 6-monooxygenase [Jongsikchunia kroppenstedtii]|uniref:3-hydroxybenzoate 6-monooxygenase n=1 Tax=Jongsikchunia kroppenstedtii TaxID=1121721 RepID=UPI00035EAC9D|nr:3-hydroxybenzoate 6-monooxygenase [Jongsikchunia kroppenstedtii]
MSTSEPILIIGGGIGGMATALALANSGRAVHLVEQASEFGEVGAGIQVGPNVMKMFDRLGVIEPINDIAFFPENLILKDALDSSEVARMPLDRDFRERFGYPYATIHRADLHSVLVDACAGNDLVKLETGRKIVHVDQNPDGVSVQTESGEELTGSILVGADGIWSGVRSQLIGDGEPRITGHIAYRAVLPMDEVPENLRSNSVVLWGGPDLHLAHYPLRRGELFNMGAIFHSQRYLQGANVYGDPEELHAQFAGVCGEVDTLLGKIEEWRMWVLRDRDPIEHWSDGRITLLGDSAHPTLQYLAQGAGMAIEDAWTLADRLDHTGDVSAALREYEALRVVRTARVTLFSRLYGEIYHAKGVGRAVRAQMLAGWTPAAARESFNWIYSGI